MLNKNYPKVVLVLGSKKDLVIPKVGINKAYFANGAISKSNQLNKKKDFESILVTGARIYLRHPEIQQLIFKSKPSRFVIRGDIHIKDIVKNFPYKFKYNCFKTNKEINKFQKFFFKGGLFTIYLSEFFYEKKLIYKIIHFFKIILSRSVGVSTGFFSLLLALEENKMSKIIISGISFKEGNHFYHKPRSFINRARVDNYLFKKLKKKYKDKIFTTDLEQAKNLNIKYFI